MILALVLVASTLVARPDDVRVEEHLGATIPLELSFADTEGRTTTLGELTRSKPLLLVLAYERCPMLCGLVLHGAGDAVRGLPGLGQDFAAVTVSFDPAERALAARQKQATLLTRIGKPGRPELWPFLHGDDGAIAALTESLGFYYYRDPASGELAHQAVIVVISPGGRISRYLYGVAFTSRDFKLALLEAGEGRTGSTFDRVLLRCYRYDGTTHRYELAIASFMRAVGAALTLGVGGFLGILWRRERRRA